MHSSLCISASLPLVSQTMPPYPSTLPSHLYQTGNVLFRQHQQLVPQVPSLSGESHLRSHQYTVPSTGAARMNSRVNRAYIPYSHSPSASNTLRHGSRAGYRRGRPQAQALGGSHSQIPSRAGSYLAPPTGTSYQHLEPGPSHLHATNSLPSNADDQVWACLARVSQDKTKVAYRLIQRLEPLLLEPLLKYFIPDTNTAPERLSLQQMHMRTPCLGYTVDRNGIPLPAWVELSKDPESDSQVLHDAQAPLILSSILLNRNREPLVLDLWTRFDWNIVSSQLEHHMLLFRSSIPIV